MATKLLDGEHIIKQTSGDYWHTSIPYIYTQIRGKFVFTNNRIIFEGTKNFFLPYSEIELAENCFIGPFLRFMPTGILLTDLDGKTYRLSLIEREVYMEIIKKYAKNIILEA